MTRGHARHFTPRALVDEAGPEVVIPECGAIPDFGYTARRSPTGAEETFPKWTCGGALHPSREGGR